MNSWAGDAIKQLQAGKSATIRPRGNSMTGKIRSGQLVTLAPVTEQTAFVVDDIVLVRVKGRVYIHLIKAVQGDRYLIGNNRGGINGWTSRRGIYGRVIAIE